MPLLNIPAVAFTRKRYGKNKNKKKYGSRPVSLISGISDDNASQGRSKSKSRSPERPRLTSAYGTETTLKVTVRMREKGVENEGPGTVYYKDDQDRFTQQHTIKLKTFSEYDVKVVVEPPQEISFLVLGGRRYENIKLVNQDDMKSVYRFIWSTEKIKTTDRKYRTVLPCVIKFKPYKELIFNMQAKFYTSEEVAHYTGNRLKFLDLDCAVGTGKDKMTTLYPPIRFN